MKNKTKVILSAMAASFLIGCGGGGGGGTAPVSTISGIVSDGYLYSAKVCYKGTNICAKTDQNGKFALTQKSLPIVAYSDENTTNTANYKHYASVLIAPAGFTKITPLSTAFYAINKNYDILAKDLNVSVDMLKKYINKDYVSLADNDENASILYGKSVVLEQLTQAIMLDSDITNLDKKIIALKTILNYAYDYNKSLNQLTAEDLENIFVGFKSLAFEPVADINKTKISIIAKALVSSFDSNFTSNIENVEKQLSIVDFEKMMALDETNLSDAGSLLKTMISGITNIDTAINSVVASDKLISTVDINVPEINATGYIYIQNLSTDEINITNGEEFNITAGAVYNAALENASSNFVAFEDGSQMLVNHNGNITLKINRDRIEHSIERVELKLTPVNGNVVGDTKSIMILVNTQNPPNAQYDEENLLIEANASTNYQIPDEYKTIDIKVNDPQNFVFATSSDSKVVSVKEMNETDVILNPISNGFAKVTVISMNKQTYEPTVKTYNITINGVDLPPMLKVENTYYETLLSDDGKVDVNFSYNITDIDDVNNGFEVNASCVASSTDLEGNLTCEFNNPGLYKVTLTASDGYLNSLPVTVYVNVFDGNVAPKLSVFVPNEVEMDTMTSKSFDFSASDLNGADTFKVYATSDNNTTVKVYVDQNESKIILMAQPKAGTAHITVWAEDDKNLRSPSYTFTVKTIDEIASLMPTLYLVPPIDSNGSLIDTRYKLINFSASYDSVNGEVLINGEINTSDGNITLSNFKLEAYPDYALYAGKDFTENNGYQYGFIFANGFSYDSQFRDGKVLVFSMQDNPNTEINESIPYYWALATKDEICNAFGDNNDTINLINSLNDKTPIECN